MNTYEYKITDMQRDVATGIVTTVSFTVTASNGTDSFTHNYTTGLPAPKDSITPYVDLTEEQVITWVKELVGETTEEQADAELDAYIIRKNETIATGKPW